MRAQRGAARPFGPEGRTTRAARRAAETGSAASPSPLSAAPPVASELERRADSLASFSRAPAASARAPGAQEEEESILAALVAQPAAALAVAAPRERSASLAATRTSASSACRASAGSSRPPPEIPDKPSKDGRAARGSPPPSPRQETDRGSRNLWERKKFELSLSPCRTVCNHCRPAPPRVTR